MATGRKRSCCLLKSCGESQDAVETNPILVQGIPSRTRSSSSSSSSSEGGSGIKEGIDVKTDSRGPVSSFVKGGIGLMVPATVDMTIAFSTSYWATYTMGDSGMSGGYGLWKVWTCAEARADVTQEGAIIIQEGKVCHEKLADTTFSAWHIAMQVMMTISLAGMLSSFIMLLLYIFWSHWYRSKRVMSTIISISYFSGLNLLVSVFVFGFKASEEIEMMHPTGWTLSWSFSLACTAFVMNQISASILVTENKRLNWPNGNDEQNHDDNGEDNKNLSLGLPQHMPEPMRAVFPTEGSVKVKDFKIGPPPKKVSPVHLVGVKLEPVTEAHRCGMRDLKMMSAPPPTEVSATSKNTFTVGVSDSGESEQAIDH